MFFLKDKNKENTTIEAIVRYKGQRIKFATGEKVHTAFWNSVKSRCKEVRQYPEGADINQRLDAWEKHTKVILGDFALKFKIPTQEEFKKALELAIHGKQEDNSPIGLVDFAKKLIELSTFKIGTLTSYQATIRWLEKFELHTGKKLLFSDMNSEFYKQFYDLVFSSGTVNSPNTFGTLIKNIKVFMNVASEEGLHEVTGHKKSTFKKLDLDADNIYLTVDDLLKIHKLEINEEFLNKHLPELRTTYKKRNIENLFHTQGRFLIGAFTALRVSDFSRIEELNIKDNFIRIRTDKNDYPVVIPIHWVVQEILDRGFNLNEKITDVVINTYSKLLCKAAGIVEPVTLAKFENGKRTDITKPKYEWVSTHTARRSGATNMFIAGIPSISIMKITGHKTEKSFLKYIKITQEENAQLIAKHPFFKKPGPQKEDKKYKTKSEE